jgi:hypothetical protein
MKLDRREQWGDKGQDADYVTRLSKLLGKMTPEDRNLILHMAQRVAKRA